jgi:hypothetical protein
MSEVILDTITGKSTATTITIGSTPVISASANSMTIRGEGSNQTSIQQGLCKAWVRYKTTSTAAVDDSFNISGINDTGTGVTTISFSNNMGNSTFSVGMVAGQDEAFIKFRSPATGSWVVSTANPSSSGTDFERLGGNVFGDLA